MSKRTWYDGIETRKEHREDEEEEGADEEDEEEEEGEPSEEEMREAEREVEAWVERAAKRKMPTSEWIKVGPLRAYVRMTTHYHPVLDESVKTMDVGSVEIGGESNRGKGYFKRFMQLWEKLASKQDRWVYVESVLNEDLKRKLPAHGYVATGEMGENFWKKP